MNKKYTLIIAFSLVFAQLGIAQWTTIEDFNQLNFDIDNEDFAKQHRPLNGAKVKMLPFSVDDQFGFVANSPQREELIPPSFTKVHAVYQEGAVVQQEERFGLISPENQWLLPPSFENILKEQQVFHGVQLAVDTISNELFIQNVYVNEAGKLLFAEAAHDQKSFNPVDTIAWFRYGREYHIRGISGHLWKKFDYDENRKFLGIADNRLLFAELESIETGNWRYQGYDVHGKLIFQITSYNRLNNLVQLSPDLFIHTESGFHFEFCDASGKDLPFIYNDNYLKSLDYYRYYRGLYQSHYPVRNERGSEMGLIARDGRMILNLEHDFVDEVKNEMVFCIKRGQMDGQFLSLDGKVVMDRVGTEFDLLMRHEFFRRPIAFDEGLMVGVGRIHPPEGEYINANEDPIFGSKWLHRYYYDQDKNIPIKLDANIILAGPFREGLAPVVDRNRNLGFINQKGKMVIEPAYDFVIQGGMVSFVVLPEFIGGFAYIASHNIYIDKAGKALTRHTEKFDFSGKWMEVRTEDTKILIGQQYPSLEFHFEKTGIVRAKEYDDPYAKLLTGRFVLQDSLLLLNPNDDTYPFRSILYRDEFVIEKHTAEELILRTNLNGQLPETRHYFLSKEKFSTFSKEEIKKQYSFTPTDSLNLAARIAEKAALEELRKSDRKAIWPGGNPAFKAYMKVHLTYPEGHARYMLVRVHFDVELDGSTSNIEIRLQKEDSYTEAAVQFVEGMTDWLPAIKDGQPQKSTTYIDIHFRYPRE